MKNALLLASCIAAAVAAPTLLLAQPVVSNLTASQRPSGDRAVDITYDLSNGDGPMNVSVLVSNNDGATYEITPRAEFLSGDFGAGITNGTGYSVVWDAVADVPEIYWPQTRVRVIATGGFIEFAPVPAGTFTMGRTASGDDATFGVADELPNHSVTLSAYDIGKFEVTNGQFAAVMNWALAQGYLANDASGAAYDGAGVVHLMAPDASATRQPLFDTVTGNAASQIEWTGSAFAPRTRDSLSMGDHPTVRVSWHGAVMFCNFLAEWDNKPLAYDTSTWELVDADPVAPGLQYVASYRLPTESEWERAAAWDGSKHFVYSIRADTLTGNARVNYLGVNPMGLTSDPRTSPVGWFNGVNVSPNGSVATVNSPSPIGAYDMSGNVWEWCHDVYGAYDASPKEDPTGASSGSVRVLRGGSWAAEAGLSRSARRNVNDPNFRFNSVGFRILAVR